MPAARRSAMVIAALAVAAASFLAGRATAPDQHPPGMTRDEAAAYVHAHRGPYGRWVPNTSRYDATAVLSLVEADTRGATGTSPQQVFFFHLGQPVGTATKAARSQRNIEEMHTGFVSISWSHWATGDAGCCASLDRYFVRYRWRGGRVVALDRLPTLTQTS